MKIIFLSSLVAVAALLGAVHAPAQTSSISQAAVKHFAKGFDLLKAGDADSAVDEFKAGLKSDPNNATAWFYLGEARLKLGSTELAETAFNKSLAIDPNGKLADAARARLARPDKSTPISTALAAQAKSESGGKDLAGSVGAIVDLGIMGTGVSILCVSSNGSVIVGVSNDRTRVFRWTRAWGVQDLGTMGGTSAMPMGVSADGSVITGRFADKDGSDHIYRWTQAGSVEDLGSISGKANIGSIAPQSISADGSVIVGYFASKNNAVNAHAFRWTQAGGVQDLGTMGGTDAYALGVSADGSVIVGQVTDKNGVSHAFRWTQAGGVRDLGTMGGTDAAASGVSADGTVIVGWSMVGEQMIIHNFRWTEAGGAQDLVTTRWSNTGLTGVSADGSVIVGYFADANKVNHAFRWTQAGGVQDLGTMGGTKAGRPAVSADGSLIAGYFTDENDKWHAFVFNYESLVLERQRQAADVQRKAADQEARHRAEAQQLTAEQQAQYLQVLTTGRPAQMYSLAIDLEMQGKSDAAKKLYQALIDRFPDDAYTAKAIDKKDAAIRAAQQPLAQPVPTAGAQMQADNHEQQEKMRAICQQSCSLQQTQCMQQADSAASQAISGGLLSVLTGGKSGMGSVSAVQQAQDSDNMRSNCSSTYDLCAASCR